jgi:hypothetical protein
MVVLKQCYFITKTYAIRFGTIVEYIHQTKQQRGSVYCELQLKIGFKFEVFRNNILFVK